VEIYEAKRWPIKTDESSDPIDVLNYAIEELGHSQAELAELFGSRSRASEILSRRRALTVDMIHKVSEAWKIPADLSSGLTGSNESLESGAVACMFSPAGVHRSRASRLRWFDAACASGKVQCHAKS
jgi:transcriptional regulator with XRE-family HTH domain